MIAVELSAFGLENLHVVERERAEPGPGQVQVRLHAASLNYRDLLMVTGRYNPRQPTPLIPCSDGAGEVIAVGPGVTQWQVGDRVMGTFFQTWSGGRVREDKARKTLGGPLPGTLQQVRVFPEDGVVRIPDHLDYLQGATLPCAAVTAWRSLEKGNVRAGDRVLVLGSGGVSTFALQLAIARGAEVWATSGREEGRAFLSSLGASKTFDYRADPKWGKTIAKLGGVDHVVEVGGAGTLENSLRALRPGGSVGMIGVLAGVSQPLNVLPILMRDLSVHGIMVGSTDDFLALNAAMSHRQIEPQISAVFDLEDTKAAFEHMASGQHLGKIAIQL